MPKEENNEAHHINNIPRSLPIIPVSSLSCWQVLKTRAYTILENIEFKYMSQVVVLTRGVIIKCTNGQIHFVVSSLFTTSSNSNHTRQSNWFE